MSVNRPTNVAQKDKDISNKLQMYGIATAFGEGKVPSNKQIDVAMNSFLASRFLSRPSPKLSEEGRALIGDVRDVIEKAKVLLLTKNEGNLLQDFIYQCEVAGTGNASKPNVGLDKNTAQQHGKQALDGLRTLGTLIVSNGQFRKLLNDVMVLARDMAGDVVQKGANKATDKINPDQEELDNLDEPAEDDQFHDTPNFSDMKNDLKNKAQRNKPTDKGGMKQAAENAKQAGQQQGGSAADKAKAALKTGASQLRGQAEQNTDDDTRQQAQEKKDEKKEQAKQKAREARDNTKDYLKEKIPKERREQTIYRLKKMIVEIQGHPEYSSAIDSLLSLAETYQGVAKDGAKQTAHATKDAHTDGGITAAQDDLKILIERFANYTSTDDFFDCINQFYRDADSDPELKGWFKHLDVFVRKALKEKGWVMKDQATDEWNKIYDQGDFLFNDRYKNHSQRFIDESKFLADQFESDKQNNDFAASMRKLFNDLGTDDNGKATFKPHLLKDVFNVFIPEIFENMRYVPIPRIEYSDPMADAVIENLIIESDNLMPNLVEFGNDNYFAFGRKGISSNLKNKVMASVSGIQMDLKDISYFIHKKHGFPSIRDTGLMDIFLGGSGFSFKLAMETADHTDRQHFFKVNSVVVDIKHMNIKLKKSKYKLMFALVKPLLLGVMTPIITKVVEKVIKEKINQVDQLLYGVYQEAQRATNEAMKNPSKENVQGIFQAYWDALKSKLDEKQRAAKNKSADKAVNIAMTKQDSLFPQVSLPGGISTKATEFKELAQKGVKWESPIFSIGSAGESRNLPAPQTIKRRPHQTAPSEVRGPKNVGQGMDAYSKQGESEVFNQGDKYGQTGSYGGEQGNYGNPSDYDTRYDGQQDYSQSAGYGQSQSAGYGQNQYAQDATYAQDQYATGATYGQDKYATQDTYGQDQYASTGNYGSAATNGNAVYSQQYPAGYTPASTNYATDSYGASDAQFGSTRTGTTGATSSSPTYATSPTGSHGTTLGMSNPVLSGKF